MIGAIGYLLAVLGLIFLVVGLLWTVIILLADEGIVWGGVGATVIGAALLAPRLWMCCL